jgi:hypothetical protein
MVARKCFQLLELGRAVRFAARHGSVCFSRSSIGDVFILDAPQGESTRRRGGAWRKFRLASVPLID